MDRNMLNIVECGISCKSIMTKYTTSLKLKEVFNETCN